MTEFLTVVILHLFAVMSPGPDFVLITRQSIRHGRNVALWTAGGIGVGILFHSFLAVTGIIFLISTNEIFLAFFKVICSIYLIYLGGMSLFNSSNFNNEDSNENAQIGGFFAGLLTNVTNVKALLFFITLFGVVLGSKTTSINLALYGTYMSVATFLWFSMVALFFTNNTVRSSFSKFYKNFEKLLGVLLILIGLQIQFVQQ